MKPPNQPGGRGPYRQVDLIKPPGSTRVVLGKSEPQVDDRRARAVAQWGNGSAAPRKTPLAGIDLPLPTRIQTVLSYSIDPALRNRLNGGPGPLPASRRAADQAVQATLVIGIGPPDAEPAASATNATVEVGCQSRDQRER